MDPSLGAERGISNSSEKGRERGRSEVPALLGSASEVTDRGMVTAWDGVSEALQVE